MIADAEFQRLLEQLQTEGPQAVQARDQLIVLSYDRLRNIARKLLHGDFPALKKSHDTESVLHDALLRLCKALEECRPRDARHFFRLSALQIRRVLLDTARQQVRREAHWVEAGTEAEATLSQTAGAFEPPDCSHDPRKLSSWVEFHEQVQALPDEEREVFDLLFYQGLTQPQAGVLLGVSERTVKYRWQAARLKLREAIGEQLPGM